MQVIGSQIAAKQSTGARRGEGGWGENESALLTLAREEMGHTSSGYFQRAFTRGRPGHTTCCLQGRSCHYPFYMSIYGGQKEEWLKKGC